MPLVEINLLPQHFKKRTGALSFGKHGIYAVIAVVGILAMFASVTTWQLYKISELDGQMEIARARTLQLQKDIQFVDALTEIKSKITNRLHAVESLDRHRSSWVKILEDVSNNVPEYVWLTRFHEQAVSKPGKKDGDTTQVVVDNTKPIVRPAELEGFTFTLNALAAFMIKLMKSNYFDEIDLVHTEEFKFGKHKAFNFTLNCNVHYLSDEELEKIVAQTLSETNANLN